MLTKDGVPVLFHDVKLEKNTLKLLGIEKDIAEMNYSDIPCFLKTLPISPFAPEWAQEIETNGKQSIDRFDCAISKIKESGALLYIEFWHTKKELVE